MASSSPAPASPLTPDQQAALRAAWQRTPVTAILKSHWKAGTATVVTVTSSMAVEDAFDQLVKNNINAAPIFDEERQEYIGMVTMHDLVEYVVTLVKANKSVWQELDAELGPPIIHVTAFQPVIDALQAMHTHRVSSVAIVDGTDRLLGNISASDVKHIMRHLRYGILFEPCSQFINKVKTRQMLENAGKDIVPVIQVSAHALLAQVLRLLIVTHVHRVWCTQQNPQAANFQAPISVVSMTDILRVLA
ncbi:hypothetical protein AMAG_10479 [Allomyces macrogynus ATCC 38327]|uniref:CBS domain-containing protein n=1 Tax=Allomyces macrogynus (strain ATCC 38327) TaxID=578462 RepID=A0A0L0SUP9_ALLM3|nr:hypothetical protein AMAG_10479 [Allomyces macrogynus ATCC 38327]|eukprot:KNE66242.1 hypothetical protein AMAG_10479 [Allomyces macrogynus ATCC 38327]